MYQIIQAKLMFNFSTWISLGNEHKHVIKGLFIHTGFCYSLSVFALLHGKYWHNYGEKALQRMERVFDVAHHLPFDKRDVHLRHIVK